MKQLLVLLSVFIATCAESQPAHEVVSKPFVTHQCIKPSRSFKADARIPEGSGLVAWHGWLWTHNDSGSASLFTLDTVTGKVVAEYMIPGVENTDWEDLGHDAEYFYVGAFGNNSGDRAQLQIIRVEKQSLLDQHPEVSTISFTWPETFTGRKKAQVNFDCEAMVVAGDSIYLFTKEWKRGRRTRLFSIPKFPGNYTANYISTLKTKVVITGASFNPAKNRLVLCGHNLWLRPFLLEFCESNSTDFFSGRARKIKIRKRLRQVEGVAFDGDTYYIINENFRFIFLKTAQEIHRLDLGNP